MDTTEAHPRRKDTLLDPALMDDDLLVTCDSSDALGSEVNHGKQDMDIYLSKTIDK